MRTRSVVLLVVLCSGLSAGLGAWVGSRPAAPGPGPAVVRVDDPWRRALDAARATADDGSERAAVLDVLNEAEDDLALAEGLERLGWVATDDDVPLLESFGRSRAPELVGPATRALGRLGSDRAVLVLTALAQQRGELQYAAIEALGRSGHPDAPRALARYLRDPELVSAAAEGLARHRSPEAVDLLVAALLDSERSESLPLAHALALLAPVDDRADQALERVIRGPRTPRRQAVLLALAQVQDPRAFDVLIADLRGSGTVAGQAAWMLGQLRDPRALPALERAVTEGTAEVRMMSVGALAEMETPEADAILLRLVEEAPPTMAARAVGSLKRVDDPEVVRRLVAATRRPSEVRLAILQRLLSQPWPPGDAPPEVLALAREAARSPAQNGWGLDPVAILLRHGTDDDLALVETIVTDGPTSARTAAVWSLQQIDLPIAQDLLVQLGDDPDPGVRIPALSALLDRGATEDVERLLFERLGTGAPDYGASEGLLARLGTPRANEFLLKRIEQGTHREASSAVQALASTGSPEQLRGLLKVADRTDDPALRQQVLSSLVWSDAVDLEEVVERALRDGSPELEATATQALSRLGTPEATERLVGLTRAEAPSTRGSALSALAQMGGPEAETALIAGLKDPDVAWQAVSGLQQLGTSSSREALVDAARHAEDPAVRASVISQLGWMPGVDTQPLLRDALTDDEDEVRSAAIGALEALGSSQAASALVGVLDDPDATDDERARVAMALQRIGGDVAEQHAERIEALLPEGVDTGLGQRPFGME